MQSHFGYLQQNRWLTNSAVPLILLKHVFINFAYSPPQKFTHHVNVQPRTSSRHLCYLSIDRQRLYVQEAPLPDSMNWLFSPWPRLLSTFHFLTRCVLRLPWLGCLDVLLRKSVKTLFLWTPYWFKRSRSLVLPGV